MTEPRDTYHHGDLRRALIDAAVAIIGELGSDAFTLREAARRAGVNHRAVYRHFSDKSALLAAVAEQGYRELSSRMRKRQSKVAPDVPAELSAIAHAYVEFALDRAADFRVMFGPRLNEEGRFPELEEAVQSAYGLISEVIARGVADGVLEVASIAEAVVTLWSAMHGFASLVLMRRVRVGRRGLAALTDRVLAPTLAGLTR